MKPFLFLLVFLVIYLWLGGASCSNVFKFGAVLSTSGSTSEMDYAKNGYQFFFDKINEESPDQGFYLGGREGSKGYYFKYQFIWREDNSETPKHVKEVEDLLYNETIHVLGGSHPNYAQEEMKIANRTRILNFQCCVGPDSFYENDYKRVFGIHVANTEYTRLAIQRLSFGKIKNPRIIGENSSEFTKTTCEAALEYAKRASNVSESFEEPQYATYNTNNISFDFFQEFAEKAKKDKVEAVIACMLKEDATKLVKAFDNISYPLKAFFITVAAATQDWVDSLNEAHLADGLLSGAQWHREMNYSDNFFGSGSEYAKEYKTKFQDQEPNYISASASATAYILHLALEKAFEDCDISKTNGDVDELLKNRSALSCPGRNNNQTGYERVLETLAKTDREIFFGRVKFNKFRRNVGLVPVTTQVFYNDSIPSNEKQSHVGAVLPVQHSTSLFQFPRTNHYQNTCETGQYVGPDPYDKCQECKNGTFSDGKDEPHCDKCPLGEFINSTGKSKCASCPDGTTTQERGSTDIKNCSCKPDFFHPWGKTGEKCHLCPDGAICEGGISAPSPLSGYWKDKKNSNNVYACDPSDICQGGIDSECRKGNTGRLCAQCDEDYFRILGKCHECINKSLIVTLVISLMFGWYILNVVVSRSVTSMEMILTWAQLANVIGDISLNWPRMLRRVFGVANILDFDPDILEPSCVIKKWGFTHNFVVQLVLPFVMTFATLFGYMSASLMFYLCKRGFLNFSGKTKSIVSLFVAIPESKHDLDRRWNAVTAAFLSSIDITYVTIAKYCFDVFKCETISGISVLGASPDLKCGTKEHHALIVLSIIGIVFYLLGSLAYVSWTLYQLYVGDALRHEENIIRFGFMYQKFEPDYQFTFMTDTLRKLLFVFILVFVDDPAFQLAALAVVIVVSLVLHIFTCPYLDFTNDVLFGFLLLSLMFEAFGGLMFYNDKFSQQNRYILEWIVMLALFTLTIAFLVAFVQEMRAKFHLHSAKTFHLGFSFYDNRENHVPRPFGLTASWKGILGTIKSISIAAKEWLTSDHPSLPVKTFKPSFVCECCRIDPAVIAEFQKIEDLLGKLALDRLPSSPLCNNPALKFWRSVVQAFPELVDCLVNVDEDTLQGFNRFVDKMKTSISQSQEPKSLALTKILNWNKQASVAHWLSTASDDDRASFLETLEAIWNVYKDNKESTKTKKWTTKLRKKASLKSQLARFGSHLDKGQVCGSSASESPILAINLQQGQTVEDSEHELREIEVSAAPFAQMAEYKDGMKVGNNVSENPSSSD